LRGLPKMEPLYVVSLFFHCYCACHKTTLGSILQSRSYKVTATL